MTTPSQRLLSYRQVGKASNCNWKRVANMYMHSYGINFILNYCWGSK